MIKSIILVLLIVPIWIFAQENILSPSHDTHKASSMKQTTLIFLGDSLIDWHDWHQFGLHDNQGSAGETTGGLLYRLKIVTRENPKTVVLMIGVNDLLNDVPLKEVKGNYIKILDKLANTQQLIILSVLPVANLYRSREINGNIRALNRFLKEQAEKRKLHYVDLHSSFIEEDYEIQRRYTVDGTHLSEEGYRLWEGILKKEFPDGLVK